MAEPTQDWSPRARALTAGGWLVALVGELWFALQALPPPSWSALALEVGAFAVLAASHVVLAKGPVTRSPLWPGTLVFTVALFTHTVSSPLGLLFLFIGMAWASWALARFGPRWPVLGLAWAAMGAVGARWVSLSTMELALAEHAKRSPVSSPMGTLLAELTEPLIPSSSPTSKGPPLVLITVDTLRWDSALEMDSVKRLRGRGRHWDRAMSTSSWTMPAMASIFTGELAEHHGADLRDGGRAQGIDPSVPMLAEQLGEAGYRSVAFTTNPWMTEGTGFTRGFDGFYAAHERPFHRLMIAGLPEVLPTDAEAVVDATIAWLDDQSSLQGRFLWVHLIDPHTPYVHASGPVLDWSQESRLQAGANLTDAQRAAVRAAYDGEVAYTDTHLSRLLDALDARPEMREGRLVFTADHGEEFWEHGGALHGHSHHTEVVDVPMVVIGPDVPPGPQTSAVSLVDVAPTLRAAAGLEANGLDLAGAIPQDRVTVAWGTFRLGEAASAASPRQRVIRDPAGLRAYDRQSDRTESYALDGLSIEVPVRRGAVEARGPELGESADMNTEALRALGYAQ